MAPLFPATCVYLVYGFTEGSWPSLREMGGGGKEKKSYGTDLLLILGPIIVVIAMHEQVRRNSSSVRATLPDDSPIELTTHYLEVTLRYQLEESIDDLDDIGLEGQVLNGILRTAHRELYSFITRCDQAMLTTEQRSLQIGTLEYPIALYS